MKSFREFRKILETKLTLNELLEISFSEINLLIVNHSEYHKSTCIEVAFKKARVEFFASFFKPIWFLMMSSFLLFGGLGLLYIIFGSVIDQPSFLILRYSIFWKVLLFSFVFILLGVGSLRLSFKTIPILGVGIELKTRINDLLKHEDVELFDLKQIKYILNKKPLIAVNDKIEINYQVTSEEAFQKYIASKIEKYSDYIQDAELLGRLLNMLHDNFQTKVQQLIRICYYAQKGDLFNLKFCDLDEKDKFPIWRELIGYPNKIYQTPLMKDPLYNKNGTSIIDINNNKALILYFEAISFSKGVDEIKKVLSDHDMKKTNKLGYSLKRY